MPTPTYIALATITLSSTDTEIQFASIPNTYRDLVIVGNYQLSNAGVLTQKVNGVSGSVARQRAGGLVSLGPYTDYGADDNLGEWNSGDGWNSIIIHLMDYAVTGRQKTFLMRNSGLARVWMYMLNWTGTAAVTSYAIVTNQNFAVGTTFSMYGIVS